MVELQIVRTGDIQIRAVHVVPRGEVLHLPALRGAVRARPPGMAPRKQYEVNLVDHVRVGHVEMVLHSRYRDKAAKLYEQ